MSAKTIRVSDFGMRLIGLTQAPHLTAKVNFVGGPAPISIRTEERSFRQEIRVWQQAKRIKSPLIVSNISDYSIDGGWFVEELIDGRAILEGERRHFLLNVLVPFYQATVKYRPLRRLRNAGKLVDDLRQIVSDLPELSLEDRIPFVLAHGDLYRDNVLRSNAEYHLIDWEFGGARPAAFDLALLYQQEPVTKDQIVEALMRLDPAGDCLPPPIQLALGVLAATEKLRASSREWLEHQMYRSGVSLKEAQRRMAHEQQEVQKFIRALLPR